MSADAVTTAGPTAPTRAQSRAARRAARRAERARRMATIDTRAAILAARQVTDNGATHWSLHVAIGLIAALWATGCVWLFTEQTRFAKHLGFEVPEIFPVIVDGGAFVAALLAYAISLSGRTAGGSRTFSIVINLLSAAANGVGAWTRSHDTTAVVVAALVPLVLMWAFHLILGEIRLRVRIRRGLPADKAPPALRLARMLFAGPWALYEWRAAGLAVTDPLPPLPDGGPATASGASAPTTEASPTTAGEAEETAGGAADADAGAAQPADATGEGAAAAAIATSSSPSPPPAGGQGDGDGVALMADYQHARTVYEASIEAAAALTAEQLHAKFPGQNLRWAQYQRTKVHDARERRGLPRQAPSKAATG